MSTAPRQSRPVAAAPVAPARNPGPPPPYTSQQAAPKAKPVAHALPLHLQPPQQPQQPLQQQMPPQNMQMMALTVPQQQQQQPSPQQQQMQWMTTGPMYAPMQMQPMMQQPQQQQMPQSWQSGPFGDAPMPGGQVGVGGVGPDDGGQAVPKADAPKYVPLQLTVAPPTMQQFGGTRLMRRKLALPFPAFREWFEREFKGAAGNWDLDPPGYKMPAVETDPLMENKNVKIAGNWKKTDFGKYYQVTVQIMNRRSIHQPHATDPTKDIWVPALEEFYLDCMPVIVKTGIVGPSPGYIFKRLVWDGKPLSTAPGHEIEWPQEARRRYGMSASFALEEKLFKRIEEEYCAFLVRQGEKCVVSQVASEMRGGRMTPTQAYLWLLDHVRKHFPLVEHPPTRSQQPDGSWADDANSSSPYMPEVQAQDNMTSGGAQITKQQRTMALKAINHDNRKPMCAADARRFFYHAGKQKYKELPVSRLELRIDPANGRVDKVNAPLTEDEMLILVRTNAVVIPRVGAELKLATASSEPDEWFRLNVALKSVVYLGNVADVGYNVNGYVFGRPEAPRGSRVQLDEDVLAVLGEMSAYKAADDGNAELQRYISDAPDPLPEEIDEAIAVHNAAKANRALAEATLACQRAPAADRAAVTAAEAHERACKAECAAAQTALEAARKAAEAARAKATGAPLRVADADAPSKATVVEIGDAEENAAGAGAGAGAMMEGGEDGAAPDGDHAAAGAAPVVVAAPVAAAPPAPSAKAPAEAADEAAEAAEEGDEAADGGAADEAGEENPAAEDLPDAQGDDVDAAAQDAAEEAAEAEEEAEDPPMQHVPPPPPPPARPAKRQRK